MSYIGNEPTSVAFLTDTFSGNGSTTAFTLSAAPATTSSILVAITGVLQDPSTYSVSGTTLTFSPAPPTGTSNISVRFLGIPASGVTTTAYRTVTEFTATSGQTTFSVPSYTVGFIDVYQNGVMLGSADYTATDGLTVVLAIGATVGDLIEVISFQVSSVLNAIPASPASVQTSYLVDGSVTTAKIADANVTKAKMAANGAWAPAGTVLQVVNATYGTVTDTSSATFVASGLTASITPSSTSSKILAIVSFPATIKVDSRQLTYTLYRNGTNIAPNNGGQIGFGQIYSNAGGNLQAVCSMNVYDSPATTSSTTYQMYFASTNTSGDVQVFNNSLTGTITLMEIAG